MNQTVLNKSSFGKEAKHILIGLAATLLAFAIQLCVIALLAENGTIPESRTDFSVWLSAFAAVFAGASITLMLSGKNRKSTILEAILLWSAIQLTSVLISNGIDSKKTLLAAISIAAGCFAANLVCPTGAKKNKKKGKKRRGKRSSTTRIYSDHDRQN